MSGYIKLHRKLIEWDWYDDVSTKTLFLHLLLMSNYKDKNWKGITIKRGEFITSLESLTKSGLSISQIRTSLKKLEKTKEINVITTNKNSIISVIKYNDYQNLNDDDEIKIKTVKDSINKDSINNIYNSYPSNCVVKSTSTGKSSSNKTKIKSLLKQHSEEEIVSTINKYVTDCKKNNVYMKNFSTFLNNLPDYQTNPKETIYEWKWKGSGITYTGHRKELDNAIKRFDHEGFEFTFKEITP